MEGPLGVFLSAFLAATILPFSSEVVLTAVFAAEGGDVYFLWALATLGNVLGAFVNWALGRYCLHWQDRRWFPFSEAQLERADTWFSKYGVWSLLFAWVPVIGDPLTFAAGFLRVHLGIFLVLVSIGKGGRYALVLLAAQGLL